MKISGQVQTPSSAHHTTFASVPTADGPLWQGGMTPSPPYSCSTARRCSPSSSPSRTRSRSVGPQTSLASATTLCSCIRRTRPRQRTTQKLTGGHDGSRPLSSAHARGRGSPATAGCARRTSTTNVANLYFFDSGAYSEQPGIGGYDWVRPNQIAWYSENSEVIRAANGGRLAPALAFFHIPILEYELVTDKVGDTQEGVFDADLNSGLFTAFVEAGDVKATFVGHDHVNDYCGKYYSLNLCYGYAGRVHALERARRGAAWAPAGWLTHPEHHTAKGRGESAGDPTRPAAAAPGFRPTARPDGRAALASSSSATTARAWSPGSVSRTRR